MPVRLFAKVPGEQTVPRVARVAFLHVLLHVGEDVAVGPRVLSICYKKRLPLEPKTFLLKGLLSLW